MGADDFWCYNLLGWNGVWMSRIGLHLKGKVAVVGALKLWCWWL